ERARRVDLARQTADRYRWPAIARTHLQRYGEIWRDFAPDRSIMANQVDAAPTPDKEGEMP
ncbi:MAG: hypothetical protein ACKOB4_00115, partial [Acidobacteriota bacterium]